MAEAVTSHTRIPYGEPRAPNLLPKLLPTESSCVGGMTHSYVVFQQLQNPHSVILYPVVGYLYWFLTRMSTLIVTISMMTFCVVYLK